MPLSLLADLGLHCLHRPVCRKLREQNVHVDRADRSHVPHVLVHLSAYTRISFDVSKPPGVITTCIKIFNIRTNLTGSSVTMIDELITPRAVSFVRVLKCVLVALHINLDL